MGQVIESELYQRRMKFLIAAISRSNQIWDMPPVLGETPENLQTFLTSAADAVNATIPAEFDEHRIRARFTEVETRVQRTHRTRSWPAISAWHQAADSVQTEWRKAKGMAARPETFTIQQSAADRTAAQTIAAREPIAEAYVFGTGFYRLIFSKQIHWSQIEPYRRGLHAQRKKTYGPTEAARMTAEQIRRARAVAKSQKVIS